MRSAASVPVVPALMALLAGAPSWAGTTGESFAVGIALTQPAASGAPQFPPQSPRKGACYSRSLSEQTRALVQVACASGEFVSIEAVPGASFLGVHGGAFRYVMSIASERSVWDVVAADAFGGQAGWGTITMLRLYDLSRPDGAGELWWDRPFEMRVNF